MRLVAAVPPKLPSTASTRPPGARVMAESAPLATTLVTPPTWTFSPFWKVPTTPDRISVPAPLTVHVPVRSMARTTVAVAPEVAPVMVLPTKTSATAPVNCSSRPKVTCTQPPAVCL